MWKIFCRCDIIKKNNRGEETMEKIKEFIKDNIYAVILILFFALLQYSPFAYLHGYSDAPIITMSAAVISYIFAAAVKDKKLKIYIPYLYIVSFALAAVLETKGITYEKQHIHNLWTAWLAGYIVLFLLAVVFYSAQKARISKNKKHYISALIALVLAVICTMLYLNKPLTADDITEHKPYVSGKVVSIENSSFTIDVDQSHPKSDNSDLISIPVKTENKDLSVNIESLKIGDRVTVYYDGVIAESYPAQIFKVYGITVG